MILGKAGRNISICSYGLCLYHSQIPRILLATSLRPRVSPIVDNYPKLQGGSTNKPEGGLVEQVQVKLACRYLIGN